MTTREILHKIIAALEKRRISVQFADEGGEEIEIGELRNHTMVLNRHSRDEWGMIFTIAHLFGHYCQFRDYAKYGHLVEAVTAPVPIDLSADFKMAFLEYEKEAFGIGKSLMQEIFPLSEDLENNYQTFMMTDFEHFWIYITTGEKESPGSFNERLAAHYERSRSCKERIKAVPIPEMSTTAVNGASVTIF